MVNPMGVFEHDVLIPIESLYIVSFQRTVLPSDEYLLEAMIKALMRIVPFTVSTSLKNKTCLHEDISFYYVNLVKK